MKRFLCFLFVFTLVSGYAFMAAKAPADEGGAVFYRGKTVEFVVPYPPGGGYDTWARIVSPYLSKHLGAQVIVRNEPGAGAKVAVNRLQKENDGLSVTLFSVPSLVLAQLYQMPGVRYDLSQFNWLGRLAKPTYPVCVGAKSGFRSAADLERAEEVKFAVDRKSTLMGMRAAVAGHVLGINAKLVAGYRGSADTILAVQRGEVDAISVPTLTSLPYVKSGDLIALFLLDHKRIKELPEVPTVYEVKKLSAEEKSVADIMVAFDAVGRAMATTPGVPKARVSFLESALKKALEEPEVEEKVEKLGSSIDYASGAEAAGLVNQMLGISEDVKALFRELLEIKG
jgi:tripartite-type tricarboxylate transporter receptor subunit TctC